MDDPAVAARGSLVARRHNIAMLLLFWSILGLQLRFGKGTLGAAVPWIGTTVSIIQRLHGSGAMFPGSLIKFQEDKFKDMQANVETVHNARGTTQLMLAQTIAGRSLGPA